MSETKWTPGPWVIDPATRPMEVCTVHHLPDDERTDGQGWAHVRGALGHWDVSPEEAMANARLIAAAPEMAGAIEWALAVLGPDTPEHAAILEAMHAALAKARGES